MSRSGADVPYCRTAVPQDKDGHVFKITKGAPNIILKLCDDPMVQAMCEKQVRAVIQVSPHGASHCTMHT